MIRNLAERALDKLQRAYDLTLETRWRTEHQVRQVVSEPLRGPPPSTPLLRWPTHYDWEHTGKWVDGLRQALSSRVRIEMAPIHQPLERAVVLELEHEGRRHRVVIDYADKNEIHSQAARDSLVYLKMQCRRGGYGLAQVVPGGYVPGSPELYRYLRPLRALRDQREFTFDVNARFGLRFAPDLRRDAVGRLSAARDLRFQGGTRLVRYSRHLREIAQSKVCVDLPGNGDFCFRLVDYLAVGACVVARRHGNLLPTDLVDGLHVVWVKDDLSDLVEKCRELVHDEERRERIALGARRYFDAHLQQDVLAELYLDRCFQALARLPQARRGNRLRVSSSNQSLVVAPQL
ncbi:MAG: glycosyltransferase [Myxococcota bacterium]|nr:glycosyltransferase [Myxococcota bacterium]